MFCPCASVSQALMILNLLSDMQCVAHVANKRRHLQPTKQQHQHARMGPSLTSHACEHDASRWLASVVCPTLSAHTHHNTESKPARTHTTGEDQLLSVNTHTQQNQKKKMTSKASLARTQMEPDGANPLIREPKHAAYSIRNVRYLSQIK